jgi:peroxiredoxin (alkyl hydroperoxide reductase subunit C)
MSLKYPQLPLVGDIAPPFRIRTDKGLVRFPEYSAGFWCVFFAHPANFTSAWSMFSTFLAMKERRLNERNTKILGLSNEPIRQNDWSDKARRYIGIYLKAPVIEDLDFRIARIYGLASGRRPHPNCDRLAVVIDPAGIIRMIIHRPLPNIESAISDLEHAFDLLQGTKVPVKPAPDQERPTLFETPEQPDTTGDYKPKPAYFRHGKLILN